MSKKDYILLASVIKKTKLSNKDEDRIVLNDLAFNLADELQKDNPAFNRTTFMLACAVSETYK
jgi:hypothetical protein